MTDEEKEYAQSQMRAALKELQAEHIEEIKKREREWSSAYVEQGLQFDVLRTENVALKMRADKAEARLLQLVLEGKAP